MAMPGAVPPGARRRTDGCRIQEEECSEVLDRASRSSSRIACQGRRRVSLARFLPCGLCRLRSARFSLFWDRFLAVEGAVRARASEALPARR